MGVAILNQVDRPPLEWRPGGGERVAVADPALMVLALQAENSKCSCPWGKPARLFWEDPGGHRGWS